MIHSIKFFNKIVLFAIFLLLISCDSSYPLKLLSKDAVILAFGDSLTYGTGASLEQAYPAQLEDMISRKVINAGAPGEVSAKGLRRLPALLKQHQPELLILCHGANDILRGMDHKRAKENLQQMINLARANHIQVVLVGVPQFSVFLSTAPFYEELSEENQLPIEANLLSDILTQNALKSDQIHPNSKGYRVMAEKIAALLSESGAVKN